MTTQVERLTTAEEFEALGDVGPVELIRGRVIYLSHPKPRHGRVANNIANRVTNFVEPRGFGQVYGSEIGYLVERDPDTVRAPDVSFVRAEVADAHDEDEYYPHGPDLAVEVVSPNDTRTEVEEKVALWLANGSRTVWVVDPPRRAAELRRADGTVSHVGEDGVLEDPAVLPGFSTPLRAALDG